MKIITCVYCMVIPFGRKITKSDISMLTRERGDVLADACPAYDSSIPTDHRSRLESKLKRGIRIRIPITRVTQAPFIIIGRRADVAAACWRGPKAI
ncbi:hypothetical protein ACLOJK_011142 [Asimina triloba]